MRGMPGYYPILLVLTITSSNLNSVYTIENWTLKSEKDWGHLPFAGEWIGRYQDSSQDGGTNDGC